MLFKDLITFSKILHLVYLRKFKNSFNGNSFKKFENKIRLTFKKILRKSHNFKKFLMEFFLLPSGI
jgi:hypothetical protein